MRSNSLSWLNRLRQFNFQSLSFLYLACLLTIAAVYALFRINDYNLNQTQGNYVEALALFEQQRDTVSELEHDIVRAQNFKDESYPQVVRDLMNHFHQTETTHRQIVNRTADTLHLDCRQRICALAFAEDPLLLGSSELAELLANPERQPESHYAGLEKFLERTKTYHGAIRDSLNHIIVLMNENNRVSATFDTIAFVSLLVLLFLQAVFIFRPAIRRLNASLATRSDFLSRISHEIRNPMNSVLGMADILKSTRLNYEQQRYIENLIRSGRALLDMLNNLIDFSSIERGKLKITPERFDLFATLEKCINLISIQAHDKGLSVFLFVAPETPRFVIGDAMRLEQVLINLLNNAVKFTDSGRVTLRVGTKSKSDKSVHLDFRVQDTGIGIRKDQIGEIFESFVQGDSSIQRKYGGSGLGLSIASELIRLMNGHLKVESQPGEGSTFYFHLEMSRLAADGEFCPLSKLAGTHFAVLSAETHRIEFNEYLSELGSNLITATSANEFFDQLKSRDQNSQIHEILIDDSLGIISMINCRNVAEAARFGERAVALIRTNFTKENMDLLRRNGFSRFLIKPLKPWELLDLPPADLSWNDSTAVVATPNVVNKLREKNLRVLLVDDSNDNLFLFKEVVQPLASLVHFAENGLEAIDKFRSNDYDVVFMDIQMPVMDGYSAIRKMRDIERQKGKRIPIYAVTAHSSIVDAQKCREAGFTDRLVKPIVRKDVYRQLTKSFEVEGTDLEDQDSGLPPELLARLIPTYLKARADDLERLRAAIQTYDFHALAQLGHKLKGSASSYGFPRVSETGHQLELAAQAGDKRRCQQLVSDLEAIFEKQKQNHKS